MVKKRAKDLNADERNLLSIAYKNSVKTIIVIKLKKKKKENSSFLIFLNIKTCCIVILTLLLFYLNIEEVFITHPQARK